MVVGARLRRLRENRGESQQECATAVEISQGTVAHYEAGTREPTAVILVRLALHYGVSSEYLLGLTDDPKRHTSLPPEWEEAIAKAMRDGHSPKDIERALRLIRAIDNESGNKEKS